MGQKIKLVVARKGKVLGYIFPEQPKRVHVLQSNDMAVRNDESCVARGDERLASRKDFDKFRVCSDGYWNNPDEYEFAQD